MVCPVGHKCSFEVSRDWLLEPRSYLLGTGDNASRYVHVTILLDLLDLHSSLCASLTQYRPAHVHNHQQTSETAHTTPTGQKWEQNIIRKTILRKVTMQGPKCPCGVMLNCFWVELTLHGPPYHENEPLPRLTGRLKIPSVKAVRQVVHSNKP